MILLSAQKIKPKWNVPGCAKATPWQAMYDWEVRRSGAARGKGKGLCDTKYEVNVRRGKEKPPQVYLRRWGKIRVMNAYQNGMSSSSSMGMGAGACCGRGCCCWYCGRCCG